MDFGDDFAPKDDVDPAAEFLAREQSVLGDLESEIISGSSNPTATAAGSDKEFLGGGDSNNELAPSGVGSSASGGGGGGGLESSTGSFEMIGESNEPVGISGPPPSRIEPEKIRKWREDQKRQIEEKDREEERKKEELRLQAKQELEDWLRQTEESIVKTKAASRNAEKQAAALENGGAIEPGTEWERIAKLCDFNPKVNKSGKDVSRMRSIYLHLKQNPIPVQRTA